MRLFLALPGLLLAAGAAHAAPAARAASNPAAIPQFDTQGYCRATVIQDEPDLRAKYEYCLRTERHARAMLGRWRSLGAEAMADCAQTAGSVGPAAVGQGSYGILVTCLEARAAARRERKEGAP